MVQRLMSRPGAVFSRGSVSTNATPAKFTSKMGEAGLQVSSYVDFGALITGAKGPTGFNNRSSAEEVVANWDGTGKVAIVTGCATGIGFDSCKVLAEKGCEVVVTARSLDKATATADRIKAIVPSAKLIPMALDIGSFASVKEFSAGFLGMGKPLNILLCSAGIMAPPYRKTKDGIESQIGTNHLGHYLLTMLLLERMNETAKASGVQGRVSFTASVNHHGTYPTGLMPNADMNDESKYEAWQAYGQSKLANILCARFLAEKLKEKGVNIGAYALHPGAVNSEITQQQNPIVAKLYAAIAGPLLKTCSQGAATQIYCATNPGAISGEYYEDCNLHSSSSWAHDRALAEQLWEYSVATTGVDLPNLA